MIQFLVLCRVLGCVYGKECNWEEYWDVKVDVRREYMFRLLLLLLNDDSLLDDNSLLLLLLPLLRPNNPPFGVLLPLLLLGGVSGTTCVGKLLPLLVGSITFTNTPLWEF